MVDYLDPRDEIFLEAFSNRPALIQPFTLDHQHIEERLERLRPVHQTSIYDAIMLGLYEMRLARCDKRALSVVTDGIDNANKTARSRMIVAAREMKVLIYTIGMGDEDLKRSRGVLDVILGRDDDKVDMDIMNELSDETGARAFNLRRVGDGDDLSRDCEIISRELPRQYTVAYLSPDPSLPGFRRLSVDIPKHPELTVRVPQGCCSKFALVETGALGDIAPAFYGRKTTSRTPGAAKANVRNRWPV